MKKIEKLKPPENYYRIDLLWDKMDEVIDRVNESNVNCSKLDDILYHHRKMMDMWLEKLKIIMEQGK